MTCGCGHDELVHYLTPKGRRRTWCTTWAGPDGERCPCDEYEENLP